MSTKLFFTMIFSIVFITLFIGAALFFPAGDFGWLNGWVYIASLDGYILLIFIFFGIHDPATLEKRSKMSTEKGDSLPFIVISIVFTALFLIPPFDYRFGWSQLPPFLKWVGLVLLIISYLAIFFVMRENSFASKGLRIHEGQEVIDSGPYAIVRHPMYAGFTIMSIGIPLTLGSLLAFVPAVILPLLLAARIRREEAMLERELTGYTDYKQRVRFRVIPGLW